MVIGWMTGGGKSREDSDCGRKEENNGKKDEKYRQEKKAKNR